MTIGDMGQKLCDRTLVSSAMTSAVFTSTVHSSPAVEVQNSIRGTGKSMNAVRSVLSSVFRISDKIRMK